MLQEHEISLLWKKISRYYPEDVTSEYRSYTKHEISKLLTVADLRDRCIILLMASSGIRVGAISNLTLKSLKKLNDGLGILTVYGESKKSTYDTLVTPECISTIDEYLTQRRMLGETLHDHSVLIRDKYSIYSKRVNRPMRLTTGTINNQMRLLLRKAVLPIEELQPDHALRKFFDTALINSNVDPKFKEMLMGHSIKLDDIYYDKKNAISNSKLQLEYLKAVDALTINDEFRLRKQIADIHTDSNHSDPLYRITPANLVSSKEYDKEKYLEMLLDSAESVLSVFGFSRSLFGFEKKFKHWWDELYQQHEIDIETARTEL